MNNDASKPGLFDDRRIAIHEALKKSSLELASYYETAIDAIRKPPEVGLERARVSTICHAIRELINGLPSVMGETSSERINPSSDKLLRAFPSFQLELNEDETVVAVPLNVATALDQLVRTAALETKRIRDDLTGLLADSPQEDHPLVTPWNKTRQWFTRWAHWDRPTDPNRSIPTDSQILEQLRLVEDVIEARTAAFFDSRHTIDDLLAQANATEEEPSE